MLYFKVHKDKADSPTHNLEGSGGGVLCTMIKIWNFVNTNFLQINQANSSMMRRN
jgi:hypothetical protein